MIVNPNVDGYTKILNHRKILRKAQKQQPPENQKNTKTEIWATWGTSFYIHLAMGAIRPSAPHQLRHCSGRCKVRTLWSI